MANTTVLYVLLHQIDSRPCLDNISKPCSVLGKIQNIAS